jgi:hypothetical protein
MICFKGDRIMQNCTKAADAVFTVKKMARSISDFISVAAGK